MGLYPNQKTIRITRVLPTANYTILSKPAMQTAMKTLTPSAFKLWVLFCGYGNYDLSVGPEYVKEATGVKPTSYKNAMAELEENGYLTKLGKSLYQFREYPLKTPTEETT